MDELMQKGFSIKPTRIIKVKSYYIINSKRGLFKLNQPLCKAEDICFTNNIKEHLYSNNFINIDRYVMSSRKKPYYSKDDRIYTLSVYRDYDEINISDRDSFLLLIKNIAVMHKNLINIDSIDNGKTPKTDLINDYKKQYKAFVSLKRKIANKTRLSDFDVYYIKNYGFYKKEMEESINLLEKTNLNKQIEYAYETNRVCHTLLKESNITKHGEEIFFSSFEEAKVEPQLFDLIYIIKRYIKTMAGEKIDIKKIIGVYIENNDTIDSEDLNILYPVLRFPANYVKLCDEYYKKKRTWAPNALTKKMNDIIYTNEFYYEYINSLWY